NNCGGVPNGVWALNLTSGVVTSWKSGASPVGEIALSSNGALYVALNDSIVALDPKTLTVKNRFSLTGSTFSTGPVIFSNGGREFVTAATKDGRIFLLEAATLQATAESKTSSPTALAAWQDSAQTQWILSGASAVKVNGTSLTPGWTAAAITSPSAPIVVNG